MAVSSRRSDQESVSEVFDGPGARSPSIPRGVKVRRAVAVLAGAGLLLTGGLLPGPATAATSGAIGASTAATPATAALGTPPPTVVLPATSLKPIGRLRVVRSATGYAHGSAPARLTIQAWAAGRTGTGTVRVKLAGTWRSVKLSQGRAVYTMPRTLKPGTYTLTVQYRKNTGYRQATARTTVKVTPGVSGLSLTRSATSYRQDRARARITIKATASGRTGTGRVAVTVAGTTRALTLTRGAATFTMPAGLRPGTYPVVVSYRPGGNYRLVTRSTTVRVTAKPAPTPAPTATVKPTASPTPTPTTTTPVGAPSPKSLLTSAWNFRDLAGPGPQGYATADGGHVAKGVVYRSNVLALSQTDIATVQRLGITAIYDLRRPTEITKDPDTAVLGASWTNIDILTGGSTSGTLGMYVGYVEDPVYRSRFSRVLKAIAAHDGPVVFHCQAGKDRTGWTAALLLSIAGVPRETITADYLASNEYLNGTLKPGDAGYVKKVDATWPAASFDAVNTTYGSMDTYLTAGLGLTAQDIDALRAKLLA